MSIKNKKAVFLGILGSFCLAHLSVSAVEEPLTLKKIMSDPDWIGRAPQDPYWSLDSKTIYYSQKIEGHKGEELFAVNPQTLVFNKISNEQLLEAGVEDAVWDKKRERVVYSHHGDIFWVDVATKNVFPVTRTLEREHSPMFLNDGRIAYMTRNAGFAFDHAKGGAQQLFSLIEADKPSDWKEPDDFLGAQQRRLFDYVRNEQNEREFEKARNEQKRDAHPLGRIATFYVGKHKRVNRFSLSSNGKWIIVTLTDSKKQKAQNDNMPHFVTEDGYVENEKVRPLVGQDDVDDESFHLFNIMNHSQHELSVDDLKNIKKDPLKALKKKAAKLKDKRFKPMKGNRAISLQGRTRNSILWNESGEQVALKIFSYDNKDLWAANVDFKSHQLKTMHHLFDEAWVNDWRFNEMVWVDNHRLAFLSEKSGFSQIYLHSLKKNRTKALTKGSYEISNLTLDNEKQNLYFKANKKHPGIYEIYRVNLKSGTVTELTHLGGVNDYVLSPDNNSMIISHSSLLRPVELYSLSLPSNLDGAKNNLSAPKQLTNTTREEFLSYDWVKPQIVEVPSSHAKQPIYSRLYLPKDFDKNRKEAYPAVMFVHGAGYLQNSHQGWSGYFREFMFHTFLTRQGYVVLDMDYRASKGYGRDWRTAIYQRMGTPELEDLLDGKQWLMKNTNVDNNKVGIYGGSYGGFMTFMALFNAPTEFAAGASLRPVTDWSSYNHGYTSNILNTPEVDPEAYNRSSPIEFAAGLERPLLIAHGMVDDNVFFKDSVRLVQRLIELEKTPYFETALYPIEPHGFRIPSSWLDEYTRIFQLFERHVKNNHSSNQ